MQDLAQNATVAIGQAQADAQAARTTGAMHADDALAVREAAELQRREMRSYSAKG